MMIFIVLFVGAADTILFKQSDMGAANKKKAELDSEQIEHERLGHIKLEVKEADPQCQEDEDETYMMHVKRSVESEKIYTEWLKAMNQVNDSESKEVILLPLKHTFESVGMCGSSGIAKLTYDYYEFVLKTEVANRQRLRKDFLQTEIWYLLYNIIRAGSKFEHLKKKIGNVHPRNILINESGQIKIISTVSIPSEQSNYDYLLEHQNDSDVFLAPEQINNDLIKKGSYPSHVDPSLAEVFCIGLTILSSGTLEDCNSVYSTDPWELKRERLNALLRTFREKYSDYLYETVAAMVALNPLDRKRCSTIATALIQYEPQILDLEPFTPSNFRSTQRPSYGYQPQQQPQQYKQSPQYLPQQIQQVSQQPVYYQSHQQPQQQPGQYQQMPARSSMNPPASQPMYSVVPSSMPTYHRSQV